MPVLSAAFAPPVLKRQIQLFPTARKPKSHHPCFKFSALQPLELINYTRLIRGAFWEPRTRRGYTVVLQTIAATVLLSAQPPIPRMPRFFPPRSFPVSFSVFDFVWGGMENGKAQMYV